MKDYTKFMNYALFTMIDRKTQDDRRSKIKVEALFSNPCQADNYNAPNKEIKRYLLRLEDLEELVYICVLFRHHSENNNQR